MAENRPYDGEARRQWQRRPAAGLGAGAVVALECTALCLRSPIAAVLIAVVVGTVTLMAVALLAAILRGEEQTCERAFRLLQWIRSGPESARTAAATERERPVENLLSPSMNSSSGEGGEGGAPSVEASTEFDHAGRTGLRARS